MVGWFVLTGWTDGCEVGFERVDGWIDVWTDGSLVLNEWIDGWLLIGLNK